MAPEDGSRERRGGVMAAPYHETDRRMIGQDIGGVLRHAREAARLNLNGAPVESVARELGHAIDCAGALVADSIKFFDGRRINIVNYIIDKGHPFEALFDRFGFVNSQHNLFVSYTSTIDSSDSKYFVSSPPRKLLFQYGDIDFI